MRCYLYIGVVLVLGLMAGAGCGNRVAVADQDEREHPDVLKAGALEAAGDKAGAAALYQRLLDRDPTMGRAHLGLAFLLDEAGGNYAEAIHHYRRYLALRPDTEKRRMLEERIRGAELAWVGAVFTNEAAIVRRLAEVERENAALKVRAANLEAQTAQLRAALAASRARYREEASAAEQSLSVKRLPSAGIQPAVRTVKVERGDSLRKLAQRIYGDQNRWRDLYEANRNVLRRPDDMRAGQVLIVPE